MRSYLDITLERTEQIIRIFIYALPAIFLFGTHIVFTKVEGIGFITLPGIYAILFCVQIIAYFIKLKKIKLTFGRAARCLLGLVAMIAFSAISLFWTVDYDNSLFMFTYQLAGVCAALAMTAFLRNKEDLFVFLRVLTVCYVVLAVFGIFEIYSGIYLFSPSTLAYSLRNVYGLHFPYTVFYNTNDFLTFVAVFGPFATLTAILEFKGAKSALAGFGVAALGFLNMLGGRARNSFITTLCFIVVLIIICIINNDFRKYIRKILAVAAALPVSYIVMKITQLADGSLFDKLGTITMRDHSVGKRFDIMCGGFNMAKGYHFMGVGVGNSVPLMPDYSSLAPINLHNMPLQIFVEYGIIIFAVYLGMIVLCCKELAAIKTDNSETKLFSIVCFLALLAFQSEGMQPSDAMHILPLWLIFGIIFTTIKIFYTDDVGNPQPSKLLYKKR